MLKVSEKTLYDLEWDRIVDELAGYASTLGGRARCLSLPFYETFADVRAELARVTEFRELLQMSDPPSLGGVSSNTSELVLQATKGAALSISELLEVADTVEAANNILGRMRRSQERFPALFDLVDAISELKEPVAYINRAVDRARGELKDSASEQLGPMRQRVRNLHKNVKRHLDSLLTSEQVAPLLRDNYYTVRDDRYVLPVKTAEKAGLRGIVHGSSGTGQTLYIEPHEMVELNNDLALAQMEVEREVLRILKELSGIVAQHGTIITANLATLTVLDVVQAKAKLAEDLECSEPDIVEDARVHLSAARHPLLLLKQIKVVPNDLYIGQDFRVLILSGANTGGKTVALKTLGLSVLMAWAGMHICAQPGSTVGRFTNIFTVMGDEQSLADDLSTFSANIKNLNQVLTQCGEQSLVLLDEIVVGTDPRQGAALAQAIVEGMADTGARCIVTTHYERLKRLAFARADFANAAVGLSEDTLKPTYHIYIGVSGVSSAFDIAVELGVLTPIITRAKSLMDGDHDELDGMVERLQEELTRQKDKNRQLEDAKRELEARRDDYERRIAALEARERAEIVVRRREVVEDIEQAREQVRETIRSLQRGAQMSDATAAMEDLKKQEEVARTKQREAEKALEESKPAPVPQKKGEPSRRVLDENELGEGTQVFIANLGQTGVIVQPPDKRGQALVEVGRLKMRIPAERLLSAHASEKPTHMGKERNSFKEAILSARAKDSGDQEMTLDLRGERVEESLGMMDGFLDRAMRRNAPFVYVIHGHGTGRLKEAIREHLARSPYVKSFRPGQRGEGQDGVTVVMLNGR
jgi:DNA mismatch repair protein MutS2